MRPRPPFPALTMFQHSPFHPPRTGPSETENNQVFLNIIKAGLQNLTSHYWVVPPQWPLKPNYNRSRLKNLNSCFPVRWVWFSPQRRNLLYKNINTQLNCKLSETRDTLSSYWRTTSGQKGISVQSGTGREASESSRSSLHSFPGPAISGRFYNCMGKRFLSGLEIWPSGYKLLYSQKPESVSRTQMEVQLL